MKEMETCKANQTQAWASNDQPFTSLVRGTKGPRYDRCVPSTEPLPRLLEGTANAVRMPFPRWLPANAALNLSGYLAQSSAIGTTSSGSQRTVAVTFNDSL